jgi:conjugative transfer signal peptidase TraF
MTAPMPRIPRLYRRKLSVLMLLTAAVTIAALAAGEATGLRVNATASMPRGLWRVRAGEPVERGAVVAICPPDRAAIREAARRGYISPGRCPGGYEPLIKPVEALGGDIVTVTDAGVAVDGTPVANTRPLATDEAGRALHPIPAGSYRVPRGELWLLSGHDPRSFDSRYFGAVPVANIIGVAEPLWVLR